MNVPYPQPAGTEIYIGGTAISFDPSLQYSDEKRNKILYWPVLRKKIEARRKNNFFIRRIVIESATFLDPKDETPTLLYAQFLYTDTHATPSSYHGLIVPDGAALLEVFRVAGKENTKPDYYAKMIVQDRFVMNAVNCLEVPGGFVDSKETVPRAARREHREETGADNEIDGELIYLGFTSLHNIIADTTHFFLVAHDVTAQKFESVRNKMTNKRGGLEKEGETTEVEFKLLGEALREVRAKGRPGCTEIHLVRAIDYFINPGSYAALQTLNFGS